MQKKNFIEYYGNVDAFVSWCMIMQQKRVTGCKCGSKWTDADEKLINITVTLGTVYMRRQHRRGYGNCK